MHTDDEWTARWIWSDDDGTDANQWRQFRHEFDTADGGQATVRITADTRYQLWINGAAAGEGPPNSFPHHTFVDTHHVTLRPGANVIAVLVNHLGSWPEVTRAGLLAEVTAGAGEVLSATGPSWRVATAAEHRSDTALYWPKRVAPFQGETDLRKADAHWREAGFDVSGWASATVIGGPDARPGTAFPWTRLVSKQIPHPVRRRVLPVDVTTMEECLSLEDRWGTVGPAAELSAVGRPIDRALVDGEAALRTGGRVVLQSSTDHLRGADGVWDPFLTVDFGRVITGRIRLRVSGPAGTVLDLGYAERLVDGHFTVAAGAYFADRIILSDRDEDVTTINWYGFRYLRLRVQGSAGPVTLSDLHAEVLEYPFTERGSFRSDESALNQTFEISRATIRLCCVDAIVDTPWREGAQWVGDVAAVTLGGITACFGDTALPRTFLRQSAATQMPSGLLPHFTNTPNTRNQPVLADYSLWWVMAVWDHYQYTGDERVVHELYPEAVRVIRYFEPHLGANGLLGDIADWTFIDWAPVDRRGSSATANAILVGALRALEAMAALKGDAWTASWARALTEGIAARFQSVMLDVESGLVVDASVDGQRSATVSEHANAAALLWDLVDADTAAGIIERLWSRGREPIPGTVEAQPFFTAVVLRALAHHGRVDLALDLVRDRWGNRMVARGATSTWEEWAMNGSWRSGEHRGFARSLSHAWSASPAEFLLTAVPGLEILEPGCRRIRVRPPAGVGDFEVTWPTPLGDVVITHRDGNTSVLAPPEMTVVQS